jgi:integrase
MGLTWADIDFEHGRLTVRRSMVQTAKLGNIVKEPKSESSVRTMALPPTLVAILRRSKAAQAEARLRLGPEYHDNGLVFSRPDGVAYHPGYLSNKFKSFLEAHGLRACRLHDLRHMCASYMLRAGISVLECARTLGHSDRGVLLLRTYAHTVGDDPQREVADKVEAGIFGAGRGRMRAAG